MQNNLARGRGQRIEQVRADVPQKLRVA